jgi:hypothetical protein
MKPNWDNYIAVVNTLGTMFTHPEKYTDIEKVVHMKHAETYLEAGRKQLQQTANAEFQDIVREKPDLRQWPVGNIAYVKSYSPPTKWVYPACVQKEIDRVEILKKESQIKGAATKQASEKEGTLFSIVLRDKPE